MSENIKIPSKTFLMGEYSVLLGGRALVLTHAPFFSIEDRAPETKFHPESPAGKLLTEKNVEQAFSFIDPYEGAGGFGGSTAEYLGASLFCDVKIQRRELLEKYFSYFSKQATPPSGGDLCAQSFLTEGVVEYSKDPLEAVHHNWPFQQMGVLVFKTVNKVQTHKHLEDLSLKKLNDLANTSEEAIEAFVKRNESLFLSGVDAFTKEQALQGLLHENTMRLIYEINQMEGVYTSRGCGAMGVDVLTVFVKEKSKEYILKQISEQNLPLKFVFSNI